MSSPPADDRRPSLTSLLQDPTQPYIPSPTPSQSILNTPQMKASDPPSNLTPLSPLQGRPGAAAREGSSSSASRPVSGKGTGGKPVILGKSVFGRAPWFDERGKSEDCYVIGVAGGSASGKVRSCCFPYRFGLPLALLSAHPMLESIMRAAYRVHRHDSITLGPYLADVPLPPSPSHPFALLRDLLQDLR
jgi:hypothetical protein